VPLLSIVLLCLLYIYNDTNTLQPVMAVLRPLKTKTMVVARVITADLRTMTTTSTTSTVAHHNTLRRPTVGLLSMVAAVLVDTLDRASMVGSRVGTAAHRSLGGRLSIWEKHT
jgi:hypothetical protein